MKINKGYNLKYYIDQLPPIYKKLNEYTIKDLVQMSKSGDNLSRYDRRSQVLHVAIKQFITQTGSDKSSIDIVFSTGSRGDDYTTVLRFVGILDKFDFEKYDKEYDKINKIDLTIDGNKVTVDLKGEGEELLRAKGPSFWSTVKDLWSNIWDAIVHKLSPNNQEYQLSEEDVADVNSREELEIKAKLKREKEEAKRKEAEVRKMISKDLRNLLLTCDVMVSCSCPDSKYRFAYMQTELKYGIDREDRPSDITNPDKKGGICKHTCRILSLSSIWFGKLVNLLYQYYDYTSLFDKLQSNEIDKGI